jgi:high frequency lysogenization protein
MNQTQQQVIALAGLFQAMGLVDNIAQTGSCDEALLEISLNSLFQTNPASTLNVFGDLKNLQSGLEAVHGLLAKAEAGNRVSTVRYALAIIQLERKLQKNIDMLATLGKRLERAENQVQHFGLLHENIFSSIASIYMDTISTFQLRVQIGGQERFLTIEINAAKIRSLLLSGIRAAMLWRQLGGHRWHFIFKRKALAKECNFLLKEAQSQS